MKIITAAAPAPAEREPEWLVGLRQIGHEYSKLKQSINPLRLRAADTK